MIARFWHGRTRARQADEFLAYLHKTGGKECRAILGNRGVMIFHRLDGEEADFLFCSLWDSLDAIRRFAGEKIEAAVYYPGDKDFLLELEPTVTHYEVSGDLPSDFFALK
ncbi:MAG: hypothetical protein WCA98_05990 [Candidatus Acidiferrales bacterium]